MKGQPHGCCTALVPRLPRLDLGFGLKDAKHAKDAKDEGVVMRQNCGATIEARDRVTFVMVWVAFRVRHLECRRVLEEFEGHLSMALRPLSRKFG